VNIRSYHPGEATDGAIAGYVGWTADPAKRHGEIVILAVAEARRRARLGRALCQYAFELRQDVSCLCRPDQRNQSSGRRAEQCLRGSPIGRGAS
jgi:GNAT superfamily N-acetyltransferase